MPAKPNKLEQIRHEQYIRAATIQVERILRYDPSVSWTVAELADQGMIRRRYIDEACLNHKHISPVKGSIPLKFRWTGPADNSLTKGRIPVKRPEKGPRAKKRPPLKATPRRK